MRKYTRKLMAAAMCAAMTASMIPASTWAGENTDEMSVIRIMGINNTVTTVNGGTVSLKDWMRAETVSSIIPSQKSLQRETSSSNLT